MKKILLLASVAAALTFSGCGQLQQLGGPAPTPAPQIDPAQSSAIVVNAEKTLRISKDTFDTFLHVEHDNRALVREKLPQVHKFAETIRANAPSWLERANTLKNLYKHNRNAATGQQLLNALNVLSQNQTQAQQFIDQLKGL